MKEVFNESDSSFYDTDYFLSMEKRYLSGAHRKRVEVVLRLLGDVSGKKILIEPNLLLGAEPEQCITTHPAALEARERFRGIDFRVGDASTLTKFKEESFDAVLLIDVLEHVSKQDELVNDIKRILKSGGYS